MSWLLDLRERYRVTSDPLLSERRLELGVLLLVVLLALQLIVSAVGLAMPPAPEPVPPAAESLRVGKIEPRQLVSGEQSAQIRARPVFFESRRPQEPEKETEAQKPPPKVKKTKAPELKLVGVFGAAEAKGIIALHKGKRMRLLVGEDVSGWVLQEVSRDRAKLQNNGESLSVVLQRTDTGISPGSEPEQNEEAGGEKSGAPERDTDKPKPSGALVLGG
ncbi:type II secretion system protein N [Parahaliea mediterranea]|uniref:Type II secretion system protein GspC N-terminal domain-containing protein n=1 Tax=Parahaliea mediterranea TaxID=651086 RepID=A0A939DBL7_9GAMM|nr:type II secretion system protein N [Parahaliea mediterranea]MBN7795170.1 hypothetical protein [Parahaliea mediterranea]